MLVLHIASQDNLKYLLLGQASKFPLLYFLTRQGQAEYSKSKILNATKTPRLTSPGFTLINGRLSHHITMGCTQGQVKHPLFLMKLVSSSLQMYTHPTFLLGVDLTVFTFQTNPYTLPVMQAVASAQYTIIQIFQNWVISLILLSICIQISLS